MYLKTQTFFVLGVSKSGYSAAKLILESGGECYIYEQLKSEKIAAAVSELTALGAKSVNAENMEEAVIGSDVLVISPGVPINHPVAIRFKEEGKRIVGEAEFGFSIFNPPVVAVTGTNGKTTTVTLIDAMLKQANIRAELVGNIGVPVTSKVNECDKNTVLIAEISSFQLESISDFKPHIACVLNISPDHLERHYTMENYIFLKKRLLKNLKESEYAVLNYDDQTVRAFAEETRAEVVWVSVKEKVSGAYVAGGGIYFDDEYIADLKSLSLSGEHNLYNSLFAAACGKLMGADNESIAYTLKNFKGVRHRMELIAEKGGVKYYDDSKSTNTASAITAIRAMTRPVVLILGGSEKGEKYEALFEAIKESAVKHTVITGAARFNMFEAAGKCGVADVTVTGDFASAVKIADMFAEEGEAVLLSPACASFDCFGDFEERGRAFAELVEKCRA